MEHYKKLNIELVQKVQELKTLNANYLQEIVCLRTQLLESHKKFVILNNKIQIIINNERELLENTEKLFDCENKYVSKENIQKRCSNCISIEFRNSSAVINKRRSITRTKASPRKCLTTTAAEATTTTTKITETTASLSTPLPTSLLSPSSSLSASLSPSSSLSTSLATSNSSTENIDNSLDEEVQENLTRQLYETVVIRETETLDKDVTTEETTKVTYNNGTLLEEDEDEEEEEDQNEEEEEDDDDVAQEEAEQETADETETEIAHLNNDNDLSLTKETLTLLNETPTKTQSTLTKTVHLNNSDEIREATVINDNSLAAQDNLNNVTNYAEESMKITPEYRNSPKITIQRGKKQRSIKDLSVQLPRFNSNDNVTPTSLVNKMNFDKENNLTTDSRYNFDERFSLKDFKGIPSSTPRGSSCALKDTPNNQQQQQEKQQQQQKQQKQRQQSHQQQQQQSGTQRIRSLRQRSPKNYCEISLLTKMRNESNETLKKTTNKKKPK